MDGGTDSMLLNRVWAMPNKWTFQIGPIRDLLVKYVGDGKGWADPFAGKSTLAQLRNDFNINNNQPFQVEAEKFLACIPDRCISGIIFDPPYSLTQVSRSYSDVGLKFKGLENPTGGFPKAKDHIARIIRPNGIVISFGWNTVGMGIKRGFEILEILIVCHGGNRNDTLCTVEKYVD